MGSQIFQNRQERCSQLMRQAEIDVLILTKPSNMFYLTGDGRLCPYAMINKETGYLESGSTFL
jgi:Xaa-Pro aminopeptidase